MTPRIEIWNSNQNQEERHYFMPDEPNTYIFGFNPKLISDEIAESVVELIMRNVNILKIQSNGLSKR